MLVGVLEGRGSIFTGEKWLISVNIYIFFLLFFFFFFFLYKYFLIKVNGRTEKIIYLSINKCVWFAMYYFISYS